MAKQECYFAFGSNMNPDRMIKRKAFFSTRVAAKLSDYKLCFTCRRNDIQGSGSANIRPEKDSTVYGALYSLEEGGLEKLDVFERVAEGVYSRHQVTVETSDGQRILATTYVVNYEFYQEGLFPPREYLRHLLAGKDILPADYYAFLESFKETCIDEE